MSTDKRQEQRVPWQAPPRKCQFFALQRSIAPFQNGVPSAYCLPITMKPLGRQANRVLLRFEQPAYVMHHLDSTLTALQILHHRRERRDLNSQLEIEQQHLAVLHPFVIISHDFVKESMIGMLQQSKDRHTALPELLDNAVSMHQ